MHHSQKSLSEDEIDLRELFMTLWTYKLFILSSCVIGIVLGIYYLQNIEKEFTSTAIFKLNKNVSSNNFSQSSQLSAFASLAGFSNKNDNSALPVDQVSGRIFIQKLDAKLNFQDDPYFNTYNPNSEDPIWKSLIKRAIGWQKSSPNVEEAIWQSIIKTYSSSVLLSETEDGSAKIMVTHVKPQRAADIANVIMDVIIFEKNIKTKKQQDQWMSYLSNTLANALGDLEHVQAKLKDFSLENSALPLESFAAESLELNALREKLKRSNKLYEAVTALSLMLQNNTTTQDDYLRLRKKYPIVDQVTFRRVLGQNEIINSWSWPKASSVSAVFDTLSERITRLKSNINELQINADRSGIALEKYARLEREARIAEATYTVLIEQVKAQSISAGFQPDVSEVYEYASAPINASAPKRNQTIALGAILGLFFGIALSSILAFRRNVYHSRESLKSGTRARFAFSVRTLLNLRNKSLTELNTMVVKKPLPILRDLAVEIHKSDVTQIVVTSSRSKLSGYDTSRALASYMQSGNMKIAVINFSSKATKLDTDHEKLSVGSFVVAERADHVSVLRPDSDLAAMELLSQKGFRGSIQSLNSTFDLVFLSADNGNAISLLSALEGQEVFHITLARTRKTNSVTLTQMRSRLPIQGLLHD